MIYAAPETSDASYCMAVYFSEESPLEGFVCQKKNPLTFHREGILTGAGHGCVEKGPNDSLWAFYTVSTPYLHRYERRIGMDLVAVDENGELYCPFGVTDTPQYIPGYIRDPVKEGNSPGDVNLTASTRPAPVCSSSSEGRDPIYATDENNLSFWLPDSADRQPTIECDLSGLFEVGAVRLFWRELDLNVKEGILPAPVQYLLEGYNEGEWFVLLDMRNNTEEKNIDYRSFERKLCRKVRLTITDWNRRMRIGLIDFAVFGRFGGA